MTLWGWACLGLVVLICLSAVSGCATQPESFKATCVIAVIGKTEQGLTVVKQYCEVE